MPDFNELVKNLYTSKNRELTQEKLDYINKTYTGKEEDFVKNFYATVGEELPQEKLDYISSTYLSKKTPAIPSFSTDMSNTNTLPVMKDSPLQANVAEVVVDKPVKTAKNTLLEKAVKENYSAPLEGVKQIDAFIEERKKPTALTMAKAINNKSQERVKVLTERVGLLKGIKDFQAQEPAMQEDIQNLSDLMQDVNQPIENRKAAQEQLKLYEEKFNQFEGAVNTYKGLVDKEKSIITDIHKDEDLRQKGLVNEYNSLTGFVDAIKSSTINTLAGTAGVFNTLGLSGDPENPDSDNNEQVQNEVRNNVKTIKEFGDSLVTQETPKDFQSVFSGEFSSKKLKYILAQGIGQTIPTVAAGFLGGAGGATITGAGLGFIESKDMFKTAGLNEKQSDWAALGLSIPLGVLEEWGISDIITKPIGKLILKETTEDVIKTLAKKELTNEAIFETVKKTLGAKIKEYSVDVAKAGWKEPLTEMEQATLSEVAKQGTEAITGKDSNAKQTIEQYLKQTGTNIAEEGVYGLAGGAGMSAVTSAIQNRETPSAYERALELKNPELLQDFTSQLDEEVKSGRLTQEQAQTALDNVKKIQEADAKIPTTIKGAERRTVAAALVTKKEELKSEIEGKDDALATPIKEEIKLIDEKLISISKGEPIKELEPTPNTKFYQGVDFKAQTGLPNGDYTEEQVKAARENKLKEAGVTPAEIEKTINAEQEIIPATEAPAAPVSGVSGEVQESGDVEQLTKEQNDKENGTGIQSNIGEGQEPIKTKPNETTGGEKIEAGGNVQASEEEVVKPIAEQKAEAGSVVGGEVELEKGNKIQWNVFGNEESGEWTVGETTKTRGGKDAVVLTKVYVEASSDGKSYTKEYADANGIKYDNERTVEHIVPLEDLQSLKETPKAETTKVTPKEGDTSITKSARGTIQNMVFKDGEWQIKFGKDFTTVSSAVNQEAQDYFNEKNAPVAEAKEQAPVVKEQAAPPVKAEKEAAKTAKATEKAAKKSKPEQIGNGLLDLLGIAPEPDVKFSKVSVGKINWSESKIGRGDRAITERNENVKNAAEDLYQGRIGLDEYNDIVDENSPIEPITEFIEPAKEEDIRVAVGDKSEGKINLDFPKGKKVGLRLDIPAYINKNIWAITVHEDGKTGSPLSYNNVARIKNVEFTSDPKVALDIARQKELSSGKKMGKATIARMMGEWMPIDGSNGQLKGESAMKMIDDIKNNPEWAQIGMNPFRHSFFYDRATGNPVVAAEEVIQIGGLVYAKNIETVSKNDERFIVKDAKGNPIIGKEGKAVRFSKKEKSDKAILSEVEQEQEIVDQMNKMNLVNEGIDLVTTSTTKEEIDVAELNSRLDNPLETINWSDYEGVPFTFTISDQLRTGDAVNPNTGQAITDLKGGIGFNGTKGNENNAWANTTKEEAESMLQRAKDVYANNKPLFDKLWKEGKLPDGHIPMAVVKMAETSILSNEAVFRVGIQNIETLPKANRKKAVSELAKSMQAKIDTETASLKRGVDKNGKPYTENTTKLKKKAVNQYQKILDSINKNKYNDIVDILKDKDSFSLPEKALIANEVFYGSPNPIGGKEIDISRSRPSTPVSKALLGDANPALINLGKITDLITEPSMKNVPNMHIVSIVGIDIRATEVNEISHPNYPYGVKGVSIGIVKNPIHVKDAFGEAYGSALGQVIKNEAAKASISIKAALTQGIPVQSGLPNRVFKSAIARGELDAVDKLAGFLRQAFPSTTFFTSSEAWDAAMEDPSVKKKLKDGDVVYAFTTNGNVFINPTLKTTKATLHETGHIWMSFVKENNPALYAKGLKLVTNTREHQKAIKEYGDTELAREEALMELMSSKGDTIVRAADRARFKEWLLSVYKYVADNFTSLLGLNPKQIENLTLDKFLEGMLADILSGKELTTKKVKGEVKFSLESQNSKIRDYIESQREAGESDSDIRAGVEMVADKLGLTKEDINNLMSENESPTITEEAEFTPNAKDIEVFKKILEGTTSDAIRINNATKEAKSNPDFNPKILEIMSNFKELKKQLMASVELTEDCSW